MHAILKDIVVRDVNREVMRERSSLHLMNIRLVLKKYLRIGLKGQ